VLDGRGHSPALHTADERRSDAGGQQRVFAEALEVPAAVGRAVQVLLERQPLQTLVDHGVDRECLRGHRLPRPHGVGAIALEPRP
jgi:hypothetical protein